MKKLLSVLLCACMLATMFCVFTLPAAAEETEIIYGDANDDGYVNAKDVLALRKLLCEMEVSIHPNNADAKQDGIINMKDVLVVRKWIVDTVDRDGVNLEIDPRTPKYVGSLNLAFPNEVAENHLGRVEVPLNITADNGVWSFLIDVNYDSSVFAFYYAESPMFNVTPNEYEPGKVRLLFDSKKMSNVTDAYATVVFDVVGKINAETTITVTYPDLNSNININGDVLDASVASGNMKVQPAADFMLGFGEVKTFSGGRVCIPLNILKNGNGISNFIIEMKYRPNILSYYRVDSSHSAFNITSNEIAPGTVELVFDSKEAVNVYDTSGAIAYIYFDVIGDAGNITPITAICPDPNSNIDVDYNKIAVSVFNGSITVMEKSPQDLDGDFVLKFEDIAAPFGERICVPLNILKNDKGILAFIIEMNYDTRVLSYRTVDEGQSVFNILPNETVTGTVKFVFDSKEVVNVYDTSSAIAYIYFDVIGDVGDSALIWTTCPDPDSNVDEDFGMINVSVLDGCVTVVENGTSPTGPQPKQDDTYAVSVVRGTASKTKAAPGDYVTVTADVIQGYTFDHWAGDGVIFEDKYNPTTKFVMPDSDVEIEAVFQKTVCTVTVIGGSADKTEARPGTVVTVTAKVPTGYVFDKWVGDGVFFEDASAEQTQFVMPSKNVMVEATFLPIATTSREDNPTKAQKTKSTTAAPEDILYGDANDDGVVNMKDVLAVRKYVADLPIAIDLAAADANVDGVVNMKDILIIRKYNADLIDTLGA